MLYELLHSTNQYTFEAGSREVALAIAGLIGVSVSGIRQIGDDGSIGEAEGFHLSPNPEEEFVRMTGYRVEEVWDRHGEMACGFAGLTIGDRDEFVRLYSGCQSDLGRRRFKRAWARRHEVEGTGIVQAAEKLGVLFRCFEQSGQAKDGFIEQAAE